MCINIGDQFARSVYYGRYKVIPIRTEIIRFCETLGMDYMGAIIWQKATTMNTTGGGAVMGSFPYPRNGILKIDYEFILIFKKLGKAPRPTLQQKNESEMTKNEWNEYFASHWNFNGAKQDGHIAMFPEELPRRLIKMFSFVDETVLDPFLGSGTTSLAAINLKRNSIGYEINRDYLPIIKNKLKVDCMQKNIFNSDYEVEFETDSNDSINYKNLPYLFSDPHRLDKKIDIKKMTFGSKIDSNKTKREDLYSVKNIISPNKILISNGLIVRLIGVSVNKAKEKDAIEFLKNILNKRRIFLKFDSEKYDRDNNLLAYVYLDNKTFVNAHLIRSGLVDVDVTMDYRNKNKFIEAVKNG